MKLGIIGTGKIAPEFIEVCNSFKEVELQAICGTKRSEEKTNELKSVYNIKNAYSDFDEFLNDELDVVYIAVPNNLHFEIANKVLMSNKNVILEKPFTSTLEEAQKLISLANENNLVIFEAITNQYLPNYLETKKLIKDLGDIKIVQINYSQYSSRYDDFKKGIIAPVFDKAKDGGALVDLGVYNIYFILGLFGTPSMVSYSPNIERGVDTSGVMLLDYDNFKCVSICAKDSKAPLSINIQGDKGCIHSKSGSNIYNDFSLLSNNGEEKKYSLNENKHRMYYEVDAFIKHYKSKDKKWFIEQNNKTLDVMKILDNLKKNAK